MTNWADKIFKIQTKLNNLDPDKIHFLFFNNKIDIHNIWHYPLFLFVKLNSFLRGLPSIDHTAHISRFIDDVTTGDKIVKIFEAGTSRGVEENDLLIKLKNLDGECYVYTLNQNVNKVSAKEFQDKWLWTKYGYKMAADAGLDNKLIEKLFSSKDKSKIFCSYADALFAENQGIKINADPKEFTPSELFKFFKDSNLGQLSVLYDSNSD